MAQQRLKLGKRVPGKGAILPRRGVFVCSYNRNSQRKGRSNDGNSIARWSSLNVSFVI
jgi:hypothetical protein